MFRTPKKGDCFKCDVKKLKKLSDARNYFLSIYLDRKLESEMWKLIRSLKYLPSVPSIIFCRPNAVVRNIHFWFQFR